MQTRLDCKQPLFRGQDVFERQLQVGADGFEILLLIILLLCELMILPKLGMAGAITDFYIVPIKDFIQFM